MFNIIASVKKNILTLTIDLNHDGGVSASGKSNMIASTEGNITIEGTKDVKLGLNLYRKVQG